jgi:hypothetical protein
MLVPRIYRIVSAETSQTDAVEPNIPQFRLLLLHSQHTSEWQQHVIQASRPHGCEQHHISAYNVDISWPNQELAGDTCLILQCEESAYALPQGWEKQVCQGTQEEQIEGDAQLVIHHGLAKHTANALFLRCLSFLFARQESCGTRAQRYVLNPAVCFWGPRLLARRMLSCRVVCDFFLGHGAIGAVDMAIGKRVHRRDVLQATACLCLFHG